jgi:hypothetical protein
MFIKLPTVYAVTTLAFEGVTDGGVLGKGEGVIAPAAKPPIKPMMPFTDAAWSLNPTAKPLVSIWSYKGIEEPVTV